MQKLWATIIKDIKILLRDGVGLLLMFVMPIILVIVVTNIQNSTFQAVNKNRLPLLVCNRDTGESSKQLIEAIDKLGLLKVSLLSKNATRAQIGDAMKDKDAQLAILIPASFSANTKAKAKNASNKALKSFGLQGDSVKNVVIKAESLTLYFNPVIQESLRFSVQGALQSALQLVESRQTLRTLYFAINEKQLSASLENEMLSNQTRLNAVPVLKDGSRAVPNASQHNVPAWTIFAMFFVIMSLSGSVVREKVNGSFIRLKTLPTNYMVGLLSKQITYLVVTLVQAAVIFSIGIWLFPIIGIPALNLPSDLTALFFVTLVTGWCAVTYSIAVGVFAQTQEQANGFGAVSIVILSAVGGLMVPSFAMQGAIKTTSALSPLHWSLEAYYDLFLRGGNLSDVVANIIPLLVITLILQLVIFLGLKRKNLI
ncbi:ABC transporter permease [Mucilaginibacter sp. L3T2-6]|uniref:ABC transporter permease n=1 Tax=Mucilaginibacter sp. L3T2-6 TaxID=3062491 RepID=UPI002674E411|nr:ABC transporter permease [Mucilaginibacter sp. L3T2-6]MDO3640835.1 ABC transporter permease [Mucilaginibacter sp. L3T2-6]MDV6213689.1 ABC transporter permease [Mucilaginibacter sp. L3T2-6]